MIITIENAKTRYGEIKDGKWTNESKWMVICVIPDNISTIWINSASGQPTRRIYINKDAKEPLLKALQNLKDNKLENELKTFDGCFNIRDVRGEPGKPSCHSFGLAVDLNAKENGLGKTPKLSKEFVKCFTDAGWTWGGNFKRLDGMHFSYGWE